MKTNKLYLSLIIGFIVLQASWSQSDCKVLKSEISLNYKGECKNGLAHGQGEAFGLDQYKGHFKKGYPDGQGTYKWGTGEVYKGHWKRGMRQGRGEYSYFVGNRDTTIVGKWSKDQYVGTGVSSGAYEITYKNNIGRVTVTNIGPGSQIRLRFLRNGGDVPVSNLMLISDTGTNIIGRHFTGFEHIEFPFSGKITFSAPNDFFTADLYCELRFKVREPGSYEVVIFP